MALNRVSDSRRAQSHRLRRRLGLLLAAAAFVWLGVSPLGYATEEELYESSPASGGDSPKHPKSKQESESWNKGDEDRHDDEKPPVLLRPPPIAPPLLEERPPVIDVGPGPQDDSLDLQIDTMGDLLQRPKDGDVPTKSSTPVPPTNPPIQTSTQPPAPTMPTTPTRSQAPCPLAEECEQLRVAAENAEEWARSLRRAANLAAEEQRWSDAQAAGIDDAAGKDRDYIATLRRQAADWRQLAADARADAKINRERDRKFPGQGWDYWARRDEEAATERDANAERIEQDIARIEGKVANKGEESTGLRNAAAEAEQRAADAETAAAAARRAYEACLERMKQECPPAAGTTTTTTTGGGGSPTGTTTSGGGGDGDDPRDTPPPTTYGEELEDGVCPQRDGNHKECVALVIDIAKNDNWRPGSLTDSKEYLEEMGCDVDYIAPTFRSLPPPSYVVEKKIWSWSKMEFVKTRYWVNTSAQRERPAYYNRLQMIEVNAAIERHRAKLRAGAIMGIEMVYAHGSEAQPDEPCGRLGPSPDFWGPNGIPRKEFHEANYAAAKGNVCIWHVVELSCYSWQGARAVDELNNYGATECKSASADNRPMHAGYERDAAHACSKQGLIEVCSNYDMAYLEDDINDVWEDEVGRRSDPGYGPASAFTRMLPDLDHAADSSVLSFSTYVDQGYHACSPGSHIRIGPYWNGP